MSGLIVDGFAGGGGASLGIERALGRAVDIAVNHCRQAIAMHQANHPTTTHLIENMFAVDPSSVTGGRPVDLAWFSPDCTHHSKAKGGKPRRKHIRGLAWVVVRWARAARPRVIVVENVEEFRDWGPLVEGRPCPKRKGKTFNFWVEKLRRHGYRVEWRELRACDYGAPTIRRRLFIVARCDGLPIRWPEPTHGPGLRPYRTAAECIDWSIPCPSIFERKRPLAEATLRRIARGLVRYVLEAGDPFIVPTTHHGDVRVHPVSEPLRTVTAAHRGELALVAPTLIQTGYGERPGQAPRAPGLDKPLGTVVAGGSKHALVAAFLAQHNTGMVGHDAREPVSTIVGKGCTQGLVAACLSHQYSSNANGGNGRLDVPHRTVTTGGHHALVHAFLMKYYGTDQDPQLGLPLHTVTAKDRFGLVIVEIGGEPYVITDIGMRMLTPRELFRAQGFPEAYVIDPIIGGRALTRTAQVRMAGNSVCPPVAEAVVRANLGAAAMMAEGAA